MAYTTRKVLGGPFVHAETCQHHITCSCNQQVLIPCFDRGRHTPATRLLAPCSIIMYGSQPPPPKHLKYLLSWAHSKDVTQIMSILLWIKIQLLPIVKYSWPTMPSEEGLSSFLFLLAFTSLTLKKKHSLENTPKSPI